VEHARASGDVSLVAGALRAYVQPALILDQLHDAERAVCELEAMPESSTGNRLFLPAARADISWSRGDLEGSFRMFEQLGEEQRSLGDAHGAQGTAQNLAEIEHYVVERAKRLKSLAKVYLRCELEPTRRCSSICC
jgi:hypothetical protein